MLNTFRFFLDFGLVEVVVAVVVLVVVFCTVEPNGLGANSDILDETGFWDTSLKCCSSKYFKS